MSVCMRDKQDWNAGLCILFSVDFFVFNKGLFVFIQVAWRSKDKWIKVMHVFFSLLVRCAVILEHLMKMVEKVNKKNKAAKNGCCLLRLQVCVASEVCLQPAEVNALPWFIGEFEKKNI